jgi:hypothetical protein
MIKRRDDSLALLLQTTLENQQRLVLLEAQVKRLTSYSRLMLKLLLWLLVVLSQMAK